MLSRALQRPAVSFPSDLRRGRRVVGRRRVVSVSVLGDRSHGSEREREREREAGIQYDVRGMQQIEVKARKGNNDMIYPKFSH